MKKIKLHDKEFRLLIEASAIDLAVTGLAQRLNHYLQYDQTLFL